MMSRSGYNKILEEQVASLELQNRTLREERDHLKLRYLENLRTLRFSQRANCRYKKSNKRLRNILNQNGNRESMKASPKGHLP